MTYSPKFRLPRSILSRYIKRIAQLTKGDFERKIIFNNDIEVSIIRLTPGFIQIILVLSIYDRVLRERELNCMKDLQKSFPVLYNILSERAGLIAEVRYYLGHGLSKFYVWLRRKSYLQNLLYSIKQVYRIVKEEALR